MRWGAFAAALLAVFVIDTTLIKTFSGGILGSLDLFLMLAMLYALCAPGRDAPIACWIIGLVQDMSSIQALGVHATGLAIAALLLAQAREWANRDVWWMQAPLAVLFGGAAAVVVALLGNLNLRLWEHVQPALWAGLLTLIEGSVVGAVAVTVCLQAPGWLLRRSRAGYRRRP